MWFIIIYSPDFVKCIPDEGLPTEEDPSNKGNLYIHFKGLCCICIGVHSLDSLFFFVIFSFIPI